MWEHIAPLYCYIADDEFICTIREESDRKYYLNQPVHFINPLEGNTIEEVQQDALNKISRYCTNKIKEYERILKALED